MPIKVKISGVFDCSSQYIGTSISGNLFSGPDLTNHLFGILNRFSLGLVAPIANTQAMFYQVKILKRQRSFLGFLKWNEGIFDSEIVDHKMYVNFFGAVSSYSSSSYEWNSY